MHNTQSNFPSSVKTNIDKFPNENFKITKRFDKDTKQVSSKIMNIHTLVRKQEKRVNEINFGLRYNRQSKQHAAIVKKIHKRDLLRR